MKMFLQMKLMMLCYSLFFSIAVFAADTSETQVQNTYYNWCTDINKARGDSATMVKFYAPDAVLLATFSDKILRNTQGGLNNYFHSLTSHQDIKCKTDKLMTRMEGDSAVNTGFYTFSYVDNHHKQVVIPARFTFVYKKINEKWMIINHHSSIVPPTYESEIDET